MRSAIVLFGLVQRSIQYVVEDFQKYIIQPLESLGEVDIFFHSWDVRTVSNPRAGELHVSVDPSNVARCLPRACGRFDSVEEALQPLDLDHIYAQNPMRKFCPNEAAARVTMRNVILTLYSLERGFGILEEEGTGHYDLVVATRGDIRFLRPISIPETLDPWKVYAPSFHAWRGVNDRFAFGSPTAMKTYSTRSAFFDGWMLNPTSQNPEWILKKWLARNGLPVELIEFPFQRIRADATVFEKDLHLM